jgi:conjugation system TraG family ATPase
MIDYSEILAVQAIENNFIIAGNGSITAVYDLFCNEAYFMTIEDSERITASYITVMKMLPAGSIIQKLDYVYSSKYSYTHSDSIIEKENNKELKGRELMQHHTVLCITFPTGTNKTHTRTSNPFLNACSYVLNPPFEQIAEQCAQFTDLADTIPAILSTSGMIASRQDKDQLLDTLAGYLNQDYCSRKSGSSLHLQPFLFENGEIMIGKHNVSIVTMSSEPSLLNDAKLSRCTSGDKLGTNISLNENREMKASYLFPLSIGFACEHILSVRIIIEDNAEIKRELDYESRKVNILNMIGSAAARHKINDIQNYIDTLDAQNYQSCRVSVNVILKNQDAAQQRRNIDILESVFITLSSSCYRENSEAANTFMTCCPGSAYSSGDFISCIEPASLYLTKETLSLSDPAGHVYIDMFNRPVVVDLWDSKHIVNRNALVIGPAGSGKSFAINNMMSQSLAQGNHVICIDVGHSYKKLCNFVNGIYFDSSLSESLSFNPFILEGYDEHGYIYNNESINFICALISTAWQRGAEITQETSAVLHETVESFYKRCNDETIYPCFTNFYNFIYGQEINNFFFNKESFLLIMKKFTSGNELENLMNSKENIDILNSKFVVFDLESIKNDEDLFPLVSLIIIELANQKTKKLGSVKKTFLVDEGLDFLQNKKTGDFVAYTFRTFRKHYGQIILAAQDINFIKNCPAMISDSILANTDTKILLDHSNHTRAFKDMRDIISLNDNDIQILQKVKFGEMFIKTGNLTRIFKNEVSGFAYAAYTSKKNENTRIYELYSQTGNLKSAIDLYLDEQIASR